MEFEIGPSFSLDIFQSYTYNMSYCLNLRNERMVLFKSTVVSFFVYTFYMKEKVNRPGWEYDLKKYIKYMDHSTATE